MSFTVAPLRLLLVFTLLIPAWICALITLAGRSSSDHSPLKGWRRSVKSLLLLIGRAQFFVMGFHYIKVKGKKANPSEASIFCAAPHTSFFDAIVAVVLEMPGCVSREENKHTPMFGTLLDVLQPVYVSRTDQNSRVTTIEEIKHRSQKGSEWPQIVIFPEGTCTNASCLITFKGGAFYPGVPVQPVTIKYGSDTVIWTWEGPSTSLKVPVTDHTYEDCKLMKDAEEKGLPNEVGLVEFQKLLNKLGLRREHLSHHLNNYAEMAKSGGYIGLEDFAKYLNLPVTENLREMFCLYDRNGSGKIDFREYVIGCSLVAQPANNEETIQLAFKMFGGDKGYLVQEDLTKFLQGSVNMSPEECEVLFQQVDDQNTGKITYDQFKAYAKKKPEYARLFASYMEKADNEMETVMEEETEGDKRQERPSSGKKED